MKTKISKKTPTKFLIISLISVVIVILFLISFGYFYKKPANQNNQQPTTNQNSSNVKPSSDTLNNNQSNFEVTISSSNIVNSVLQLRTMISGVISSNGNCTAELSKDGVTKTFSAKTFAMTDYSTCQGFDIDTSSFDNGTWNLKMTVSIDNMTKYTSMELNI